MFFLYSVFSKLLCYLDFILVSVLDKHHPHSFFLFLAEYKSYCE